MTDDSSVVPPFLPVSDAFAVLAYLPTSMDSDSSPFLLNDKLPPVSIMLKDSTPIPIVQSIIKPDSHMKYSSTRLRIRPSTKEEYK